jgi:hypothetical protein
MEPNRRIEPEHADKLAPVASLKKFCVTFTSLKQEVVYAASKNRAKVLAQAEQIKKGNKYSVACVHVWDERGHGWIIR